MWNKWKYHFSKMKGDVGIPFHEKEGKQEDAYTKTELITPSLHLCVLFLCVSILLVKKVSINMPAVSSTTDTY